MHRFQKIRRVSLAKEALDEFHKKTKTPVKLFYSYSHKDEKFKENLSTHLAVLKRRDIINDWHDRKIAPSENWEIEINRALLEARIVLLLVSANFLASDYCYETETIFALERHVNKQCIVVPVIIKPCKWEMAHFSHLQALPENGKAVSTWKNKDEAWLNVANGIALLAEKLQGEEYRSFISVVGGRVACPNRFESDFGLAGLLYRFLLKFDRFFFSPLRIQKWGGLQSGFEELLTHSTTEIQSKLDELAGANLLRVIKSNRGNRLYRW